MNLGLVQRRTIWFPTLRGWVVFLAVPFISLLFWWFKGESYLSLTERQPPDVMVVEGWIGIQGVHAAAAEFAHGGYRYVVATGGLTGERGDPRRWNVADWAAHELVLSGVPQDKIITASCTDPESHRTFESAIAVWQTLQRKGIAPATIDVFTRSSHARRSRLVFAKVFQANAKVGVISWIPPGNERERWWHSSERSVDFIKETIGYLFEMLLNSGRWSNTSNVTGKEGTPA